MIPECFDVYNALKLYGDIQGAGFSYAVRMCGDLSGQEPGYASRCIHCGECLDKCPQMIEIPDMLAEAAAELEGPDLEQRVAMVRQMLDGEAR
jgi:predicted aldo/keto reductase-like oxidoreductase